MTHNNLLILIDGSSYLHRAFHALPELATSQGEPTGAIYGVISMIRKIINDYDPEYIAVVFDAKGKNFRHEIYPQYKATRPPMHDELSRQIAPLHEVIHALGLPLISVGGVEADDVIATLTKHAVEAGLKVLISTGDKDLAQLVNDKVTLINTMSNTTLDVKGVQNKFSVLPEQILDYLTLLGDSSDNVPGVPMVGPKTAAKLINEYGSLQSILNHAHEVKGKVGENLRQSLSFLPVARQLLTIKDNVHLAYKISDLTKQLQNKAQLVELFKRLEFKSWLSTLLAEDSVNDEKKALPEIAAIEHQVILTSAAFQEFLATMQATQTFAFLLITANADVYENTALDETIIGIAIAAITAGNNQSVITYIPFAHEYIGVPEQLDRNYVLGELTQFFEDAKKMKLGHNLKYALNILKNYGIDLTGENNFDTMLGAYVLNNAINNHDLETLAFKYLGTMLQPLEDIAGKGAKQLPFSRISLELASPFAAGRVNAIVKLYASMQAELDKHPALNTVFRNIDMPLTRVLAEMELCGVKLDIELLRAHSQELGIKLAALEEQAYKIAGKNFNLNSPAQLQEILFSELHLPILYKTPKGQPSTAERALQELALDYPLPALILDYRGLSKLKSTYTDSLPLQVNSKTKRVHTSYNQAVTATGRLSSTNPNLQNIPIRDEEGRRIRRAFIADVGYQMISADYSQVELRIMAHLAHDEGLIKAFASGGDVHRATAAEVFGVELEAVTDAQRQRAKVINFGLIYGMSSFGLAQRLGMSKEAAHGYIEVYFQRYPAVKAYMDKMRNEVHQLGYAETIFGRRLYIPDIHAKNFQVRAAAERAAINAPIQGSAADIMKIAMIKIAEWIKESRLDVKMLMQVHDELVFEIADADMAAAVPRIKAHMESAAELSVPILVHVGSGKNWDEAH